MRITEVANYTSMSEKAEKIILREVRERPLIMALPTGSTPEMLYSMLVEEYKRGKVNFSEVVTFNLDEYVGLSPANPNSYHYYMNERFLKHVNVSESYIPDGMAQDLEKECADYENKIKREGGIDLAILGIGGNGHIAFNEPGTSFESRTHVVKLSADTLKENSRFGEMPNRAITMGIGTLMCARKIILLASGKKKARALKMMMGAITEEVPASVLQKHSDCKIIADGEALRFF